MTRKHTRKVKPLAPERDVEAFKPMLDKLLASEMRHIIEHYELEADDILRSVWPEGMLETLRGALPYAYTTTYPSSEDLKYNSSEVRFHVAPENCNIAQPSDGHASLEYLSEPLSSLLSDMISTVLRYREARATITNLFKEHPMSEVRYLLPQIQALLPVGHNIRNVNPKPCSVEYPALIDDIRNTVSTLTRGLMSNPDRPITPLNKVGFSFYMLAYERTGVFWVA